MKIKPGNRYHFFDDGKLSPSRHYIATIKRVLTGKEAKKMVIKGRDGIEQSLYAWWEMDRIDCPWVFKVETEYFLEIEIPGYGKNEIHYAVQANSGDWFTLGIDCEFDGGSLDISGDLFNTWEEYFPEEFWKPENQIDNNYAEKDNKG